MPGVFSPQMCKAAESGAVGPDEYLIATLREVPVVGSTHCNLSQTRKRDSKICSVFVSVAIKLPSCLQWLWLIAADISDSDT